MEIQMGDLLQTGMAQRQPALLSYTVLLNDDEMGDIQQQPLVQIVAEDLTEEIKEEDPYTAYRQDSWLISGSRMHHDEVESDAQLSNMSFIASNLYTHEKDQILQTLKDETIFAAMYDDPASVYDYLNMRGEATPVSMMQTRTSFITTKPVLFPNAINRHDLGEMRHYLFHNISPFVFQPYGMSETNLEIFHDLAEDMGSDLFAAQFIAIRQEEICDAKTGEPLEEDVLRMLMDYDSAEREVLFRNQYSMQESWLLGYALPQQFQTIGFVETLEDSVSFLRQAEQVFIDPFYQQDKTLAFLDEKTSIISDFRPSHYSHIGEKHQIRIGCLRHDNFN